MAQPYQFQFVSLEGIHKIKMNPALSIKENKEFVVEILVTKDIIIEEIVKKIQISLDENPQTKYSSFLENIKKKLNSRNESIRQEEEDETESSDINTKENEFLVNAFQFLINGKPLSLGDEKSKLEDLNIQKNQTICVTFNVNRAFELQTESSSSSSSTVPNEGFSKCKLHKNTQTTHYCNQCKRFIYGFDIIPSSKFKSGLQIFSFQYYQLQILN